MNGFEAFQKDKKYGFYVEFDKEYQFFGVFGLETGFCYLLSDEKSCEKEADKLNNYVE